MPIKIQNDLPAKGILEHENIFVIDEEQASHQDIRPVEICILNIMPLKEETELQLLRSLSNTPLQVNVTFLMVATHEAKHTSKSHLNDFYEYFDDVKDNNYDGLIITGAPLEFEKFEDVDYWDELCQIMEWSKSHVTSTLHLCWGAFAGLYYHYGIDKHITNGKVFGVYEHKVLNRKVPLVRGFDDIFLAPHSRHTKIKTSDIEDESKLVVLGESEEVGVYLCMSHDGKRIFVLGHPEYDRLTLDQEYKRDLGKGLEIEMPVNYYPNDDVNEKPILSWRSHANALYSNWLNYYVYQQTPYEFIDANNVIKKKK